LGAGSPAAIVNQSEAIFRRKRWRWSTLSLSLHDNLKLSPEVMITALPALASNTPSSPRSSHSASRLAHSFAIGSARLDQASWFSITGCASMALVTGGVVLLNAPDSFEFSASSASESFGFADLPVQGGEILNPAAEAAGLRDRTLICPMPDRSGNVQLMRSCEADI